MALCEQVQGAVGTLTSRRSVNTSALPASAVSSRRSILIGRPGMEKAAGGARVAAAATSSA